MATASLFGDSVTALLLASIPGVLIALLTQYLNVTLSAEEKKYLDDGGRWWPGRYVDIRKDTYARLERAVTSVLGAASPLKVSVD